MDPLSPLISALHDEGRIRVWSLVITIIGDAAQPRGGRIALARLQDLAVRIGIEAGALRTALSRLTADGWVERERSGRSSNYLFSARGAAEYEPAAKQVYAPPTDTPERWTLALVPEDSEDGFALGGNLRLVPGAVPAGAILAVDGELHVAAEKRQGALCPPSYRVALERLFADLDALSGLQISDRDAMAARVLLIHRWRRIILRHPELPDALLPATLTGPRARVAFAYKALLPGSERWLDSADDGFDPMPAPARDLAKRFSGN